MDIWYEGEIYPGYMLVGDVFESQARLTILHPDGKRVICKKSMGGSEYNHDDILNHFTSKINKIKNKSLNQIKIIYISPY